ncbi:MAG: Txe/YoeB family addiction module toxin [Prevotellaceae bacterium]|jgi:toxin YoeB|nr:Txe/YoeB family addiction module toxin [Prevotellaceae bacterium]
MKIIFTPHAYNDYQYWRHSGQKRLFDKINRLLIDISEHPYTGTGKPELAGKWSRRINSEHRIIYSVNENMIEIHWFSMRYHYSK